MQITNTPIKAIYNMKQRSVKNRAMQWWHHSYAMTASELCYDTAIA